jgi:nitroreductase
MFFDLLYKRRSIRSYTSRPVESDKIDRLKKAALLAPSSMSRFPCRFIFITDKKMLAALSESKKHGAEFLKNAPLAVAVTIDPDVCDVWIEDASIAATYLHLAAESLGLGSCWVQIRKRFTDNGENSEEYIKKLLGLPAGFRVLAIIGIGYPVKPLPGHTDDELRFEHIFLEKY